MAVETCSLQIDNEPFNFEVTGEFSWGEPEKLYKEDDNVISKVDWTSLGYGVVDAFTEKEFDALKASVRSNILRAIQENKIEVDPQEFRLEDYHKIVTKNDDHLGVIDITRNLTNEDFDFDIELLVERFGNILGYKLTSWVEELQKTHIQIRINRPSSLDINPPHKDGYLSYWEDIVNVWIPIAGCTSETSLPVAPGSHLLSEDEIYRTESKGATINGNTYYVPCILKTKSGNLNMVRPNPAEGEALLFSPFLIHGAAVNRSEHTRVSMELRFPKLKS
ncbi:MAG: phytanoyl-CoA dioxygenase [Flavobacteriaceae bacterium]|nr:phytanoyl-CoA dioxygenase [Flavobacteriaceae bacterium]